MAYENRIEAYAETPADLTFGSNDDHFWIRVGPKYQATMTIRIIGGWAKELHEALGRHLHDNKGNEDEDAG